MLLNIFPLLGRGPGGGLGPLTLELGTMHGNANCNLLLKTIFCQVQSLRLRQGEATSLWEREELDFHTTQQCFSIYSPSLGGGQGEGVDLELETYLQSKILNRNPYFCCSTALAKLSMSQKVLLSSKEINIILHRLACQLLESHLDFKDTVLIGIQPRGIFLAARLAKILKEEYGVD